MDEERKLKIIEEMSRLGKSILPDFMTDDEITKEDYAKVTGVTAKQAEYILKSLADAGLCETRLAKHRDTGKKRRVFRLNDQ